MVCGHVGRTRAPAGGIDKRSPRKVNGTPRKVTAKKTKVVEVQDEESVSEEAEDRVKMEDSDELAV
jgi:hypothetical protein